MSRSLQQRPGSGVACCRVEGSECSSTCMDLLKEVSIILITSTIVWPQVSSRKGTQFHSSTKNWIKDLLSLALTISTKPSFTFRQSLPSASYSSLSDGRQTENHNHRKLTNLITWTTALSNLMKLLAMPCRDTQEGRVMVKNSDKMWSTGEGMTNHFNTLALRTP